MVEIYIERRQSSRPSRRRIEKIGEGPDQSGSITLNDGTILDLDMSRVHPDYDWHWGNQSKLHWPVDITSHPAKEAGPTESPYLQRMTEGVTIQLDELGEGQVRLTDRRHLIVQLGQRIIAQPPDIRKYYPDYPELSGIPDFSLLEKFAELGAILEHREMLRIIREETGSNG